MLEWTSTNYNTDIRVSIIWNNESMRTSLVGYQSSGYMHVGKLAHSLPSLNPQSICNSSNYLTTNIYSCNYICGNRYHHFYACMYVYTYLYACMRVYMHVCMCVCSCLYSYIRMYEYACMHVHVFSSCMATVYMLRLCSKLPGNSLHDKLCGKLHSKASLQ